MSITTQQKAPLFTLLTDANTSLSLRDLRGKKVVLYFYPKDNTPGCTTESCDFRDNFAALKKLGAEVIGISKDSVKSHQNFKEKYSLPFTLVSDPDGSVCESYGVMVEKNRFGKKYQGIERSTFLIDENGIIIALWRKVKVDGHVTEIMQQLKK